MGTAHQELIADAVRRTVASRTAKICLQSVMDTKSMLKEASPPPVRRAGLRGAASWAGEKAFELFIKQLGRYADAVRPAEGFLDFESRWCALDYGAYAELIHGSSRWSGRSGRAIATLPEEPPQALSALWLFDLLRGVTEASEVGDPPVGAQSWRHLRASVDIARVSAAVPGNTPLPGGVCYEELHALPLDVWLDGDGYVRRIRFEQRLPGSNSSSTTSLELFDLGTEDATFDPSRLPLFRDPKPRAVA